MTRKLLYNKYLYESWSVALQCGSIVKQWTSPATGVSEHLNGHSKANEYYYQACLSQLREQYTAVVQVQARAHQVFAVSTAVIGVMAAALINAEPDLSPLSPLSQLIGAMVLLSFIGTVIDCIKTLRPVAWRPGPQMDQVKERLPQLADNAGLWFGRQMNNYYRINRVVQDQNANRLQRALWCLFAMILLLVVFGVTVIG